MNTTPESNCQSCGMAIDDGTYCSHCTDEHGDLQCFEERFSRMQQWLRRRDSEASAEQVRSQALAAMAQMPAWRDCLELQAKGYQP